MRRRACEEQLEDAHAENLPEFGFRLLSGPRKDSGDQAVERALAANDARGDIDGECAFGCGELVAVCEVSEGILKKAILAFGFLQGGPGEYTTVGERHGGQQWCGGLPAEILRLLWGCPGREMTAFAESAAGLIPRVVHDSSPRQSRCRSVK